MAAAAIAALGAVGCGGSSKAKSKSGSSTSPAGNAPGGSRASQGLVTVQDDAVTAGRDSMRVTVYDLRRSGPFVILDFGIVCLKPDAGCDTASDFAAPSRTPQDEQLNQLTPDGVSLVDPIAAKRYFGARDSQGRPDASQLPDSIRDSSTHLASVKFAAPPASVSALDVLFPNGGPQVSRLPISSGPGPSPSQLGPNVVPATAAPFDKPPDSIDATGLGLRVVDLVTTVGNRSGSDAESAGHATITLNSDVLFQFAKSSLTPGARAIIGQVATKIKANAKGLVSVTGYTDSVGSDSVNIPLSQARASTVVTALKPRAAGAAVSFLAAGRGSNDPVAPNMKPDGSDNPAGRALNRRVTITYAGKAPTKPTPLPAPAAAVQSSTTTARTVTYSEHPVGAARTAVYQVTVSPLARSGALAVLHLLITCQRASGANSDSCTTGFDLAGNATVPPLPADQMDTLNTAQATASAVYLVDPATGTAYIPVRDADDRNPLSTNLGAALPINESDSVWLYFPAPPTTVSSLTVALPGGVVRVGGVPIATGQ